MNTPLRIISTLTPDGEFHILINNNDVALASGFGAAKDIVARLPKELRSGYLESLASHPYQKHVESYFDGNKAALDSIPRTQAGSDFQKRVWHAISSISYGNTISYKQLAKASGNPAAIRAAGTICGLNKLILLIPCHRVLKSDGSIGSYLYGSVIKESLLRREGAV
jgi:methylated-DNA-[protein]-cysteine S-methyltransferase